MLTGGSLPSFLQVVQNLIGGKAEREGFGKKRVPDFLQRRCSPRRFGLDARLTSEVTGIVHSNHLTRVTENQMSIRHKRFGQPLPSDPPLISMRGCARRGRDRTGREWKSRSQFLGHPVVHVAWGFDPKTGKKRVARGLIAIGDIAIGGLAIGGVAVGLFSLGGFAVGVTAFGGAAVGLQLAGGGASVGGFAIGGAAAGLVAMGGAAAGAIALGGAAAGYIAIGGGTTGKLTFPAATRQWSERSFSDSMLGQWLTSAEMPAALAVFLSCAVLGPLLLVLTAALAAQLRAPSADLDAEPMPREIRQTLAGRTFGWIATVVGMAFLLYMPFNVLQILQPPAAEPIPAPVHSSPDL